MQKFVSNSTANLRPSGIRRYFDIAATMEDVITLGIGEPNFTTPHHVMNAGIQSLRDGNTGYTSNAGLLELRVAISNYIQRLYNLYYHPQDQVLVTVGVSEALWLAMKTILDPGDEVLVVEPCFVANAASVEMAGGVPVMVPTSVENEFQVTAQDIEQKITARTKAILLSYPNNPTGAVLSAEYLQEIADVAESYDLVVISDEIYERLVYTQDHIPFASLPNMQERTITLSGMSKSFAMTGWRIGYATSTPEIIDAMKKLHQYLIMSAPTIGQVAALEALDCCDNDVIYMRDQYDNRRQMIHQGFQRLGLTCFEPKGAFYAFPSIANTGMSDTEFCEQLLRQEKVAVVPGSAFGESGNGFIRASYANSEENIQEALYRIERFLCRQTELSLQKSTVLT